MLSFQFKDFFFDKKKVLNALDRASKRVLSKFGSFVWRGAKSSIRKRKRVSKPGFPPSSHQGNLRKLIFFGYDPGQRKVVIGPIPYRKGEAPRLLEFGGRRTHRKKNGKIVTQTFDARPFMGPALKEEEPKLAGMWANAITK